MDKQSSKSFIKEIIIFIIQPIILFLCCKIILDNINIIFEHGLMEIALLFLFLSSFSYIINIIQHFRLINKFLIKDESEERNYE